MHKIVQPEENKGKKNREAPLVIDWEITFSQDYWLKENITCR